MPDLRRLGRHRRDLDVEPADDALEVVEVGVECRHDDAERCRSTLNTVPSPTIFPFSSQKGA